MSSNKWISVLVVLGLALAVMGCGGPSEGSSAMAAVNSGKVVIYNWSYYVPQDVLDQFTTETGIAVDYQTFPSNEEMLNQINTGGSGYDVVFPGADYAEIMKNADLIEKLDATKLPNMASVDPVVSQKKKFDPNNEWAVPYFLASAGIFVNKEKVPSFEKSWSIYDNAKLINKMELLDDPREVMGAALAYLGLSVNSVNPDDIAKAKDVVLGWKKNISKFDSDNYAKDFTKGDAWVVHAYAENVWLEITGSDQTQNEKYKDKYEFFIPKEGNQAYMDTMVILKNAPNKENAYKFIDYILRPDVNAKIANWARLPSVSIEARKLVTQTPNYPVDAVLKAELKLYIGDAFEKLWLPVWDEIKNG